MNYSEKLNEYISQIGCTAKELSSVAGVSTATLSRYRGGKRVPEIDSWAFKDICSAIVTLYKEKNPQSEPLDESSVAESFLGCPDIIATDKKRFRQKLNTLIAVLNINITKLCSYTNYDTSALFRIRNGSRNPSDPMKFASDIAEFVSGETLTQEEEKILSRVTGCPQSRFQDTRQLCRYIRGWLIAGRDKPEDSMGSFLEKLDEFDLNQYIKSIHFDRIKVINSPFQLPTSKTYYGLNEMMNSEIDFLKLTVLSKSSEPVIMYSDMPMEEMSKDPEFPKKWMFGMAMMLKKGLCLKMIHNIDRPMNEMMLGLESWIPMYMTGQVTPFYLENAQNDVFLHFLKVSGSAALRGEAIAGSHSQGRYYLTNNKNELSYYKKRSEALLSHALPLMDIYRRETAEELQNFLLKDALTSGKRRKILPAPPIYTIKEDLLDEILSANGLSEEEKQEVRSYYLSQKKIIEELLKNDVVEDEVPDIPPEEFRRFPLALALPGIFLEKDIYYTYSRYRQHLEQTAEFEKKHSRYIFKKSSSCAFRNLRITIHEGKWAMVSKSKSPAINFVIHHPKLCSAIEKYVPPIIEQD